MYWLLSWLLYVGQAYVSYLLFITYIKVCTTAQVY